MLTGGSLARVRRETADLMLLVTMCLWALNFSAAKYILNHGVAPLSYSTIRYAFASCIFAGITYAAERSLRVARRDLPLVGLSAAILFVNQVSWTYALHFSSAA